jgi:hypothetical protein
MADGVVRVTHSHPRLAPRPEAVAIATTPRSTGRFGDQYLDEIMSLEVERFRDSLLGGRTVATSNRYRDLLSALFR